MKRTIATVLLAMLTLAAVPIAVFADDNTGSATTTSATVDAGTTADMQMMQQELTTMDNGVGAKMRLLQLERQLDLRIAEANALITALDARNANTTDLKDDVAQLQVLVTQIQDKEGALGNTGTVDQATVDFFVATRTDAQTIIKHFHDIAKGLVTDADRKAAKDAASAADKTVLADIQNQIDQLRRDYNADRLQASLTAAGISDTTLVANVRNGTEKIGDALKSIRKDVLDLPADQRKQAISTLLEAAAKRRVQALAHLDAADRRIENETTRLEDRIKILQGMGKNMTAMRLQLRDDKLQLREGKVDERIGDVQGRMNGTRPMMGNRTGMPGRDNWTNRTGPRGNWTNRTGPWMNQTGSQGGDDAAGQVNADANVAGSDDNVNNDVTAGVTP